MHIFVDSRTSYFSYFHLQFYRQVVIGNKCYTQKTIQVGKAVRAFALGSSETGEKADFGINTSEDGVENGDSQRLKNGESVLKKGWFTFHKIEGLVLATGCQKGQIRCWNVYTGKWSCREWGAGGGGCIIGVIL